MTATFARGTSVTEDRTRAEIEKMLGRYGATRFGVLTDYASRTAVIGFTYKRLNIEMKIQLPDPDDKRFKTTPSARWRRNPDDQRDEYDGEVRRKWRCLAIALKAKLVAVEDGITTFEREFLPYIITADGRSIADRQVSCPIA